LRFVVLVWGLGSGFRGLGFGIPRNPGSGFQASGFAFLVSGFGVRVWNHHQLLSGEQIVSVDCLDLYHNSPESRQVKIRELKKKFDCLFFFFTPAIGPGRSLSLKFSDTRVYELKYEPTSPQHISLKCLFLNWLGTSMAMSSTRSSTTEPTLHWILNRSYACLVSGFGFRVSGFGFQASGFGFRVSGFGFCVSSLGFEVWGLWFPGFGSQVSGFWFWVSGFGYWVSGLRVRVSGFGFTSLLFSIHFQYACFVFQPMGCTVEFEGGVGRSSLIILIHPSGRRARVQGVWGRPPSSRRCGSSRKQGGGNFVH
jgi:hypothetical protein